MECLGAIRLTVARVPCSSHDVKDRSYPPPVAARFAALCWQSPRVWGPFQSTASYMKGCRREAIDPAVLVRTGAVDLG